MASSDFKLRFDGKQHDIDVDILINSLVSTTSIIKELNTALDPSRKIEIKVKAPKKGSFLIQIELTELGNQAVTYLTGENVKLVGGILTGLVALFKLKQFLQGDKAKSIDRSGERAKVENTNGSVNYFENLTVNIYDKNPSIQENLTKTFESISGSPAITGFEILDSKNKKLFKASRKDIIRLASKDHGPKEEERVRVDTVKVTIARLSFEKGVLWEVYYKGNKIKIKLDDPDFQTRIDNGETFAKGDVLKAELRTFQKWDETVNTYINKSYSIGKILEHISRTKQKEISFTPEKKPKIPKTPKTPKKPKKKE